jgi:hypothetical protein
MHILLFLTPLNRLMLSPVHTKITGLAKENGFQDDGGEVGTTFSALKE